MPYMMEQKIFCEWKYYKINTFKKIHHQHISEEKSDFPVGQEL